MVTYPSLCSTYVTYGTHRTLSSAIGHQMLPTLTQRSTYVATYITLCAVGQQVHLGKRRISLGVTGILSMYLCPHT